jgi:predicted ATPase
VLGAYRDNEVFAAHPLMLTLNDISKKGANIDTLTLTALVEEDITRLVADTLLCSTEIATPLSQLVYQKTRGNPFFATQFLKGLHEDGWITFEAKLGYWQCNLAQVRLLALTDDVVAFMGERLRKLPEATQEILKLSACIGNQFDLETLAVVCEKSQDKVAADIWGALQEGLVFPVTENYKFFQEDKVGEQQTDTVSVCYRFLHDRVQQAAYALIPDNQKQITHYHIGQLLLQKIPPETREDYIFELVNQLNYGTAFITEQKERDKLAQLNLIACRKARSTTAYQAGREYATTGLYLLGENPWQRQYYMTLYLYDIAAELASLCGDFKAMEQFVRAVITQAHSLLDQVHVYRLKILSNASHNKLSEAIVIAQEVLQQLGVTFPEAPTESNIQQAVAEINQLIGNREIEDLVNLPMMTDKEKIAIIQIANSIIPVAYVSGSPLFLLLVVLSVKLSIQYGNISVSALAYAAYGVITCNLLRNVDAGVKFGQLALQVASQLEAKTIKPEALFVAGMFISINLFQKLLAILMNWCRCGRT